MMMMDTMLQVGEDLASEKIRQLVVLSNQLIAFGDNKEKIFEDIMNTLIVIEQAPPRMTHEALLQVANVLMCVRYQKTMKRLVLWSAVFCELMRLFMPKFPFQFESYNESLRNVKNSLQGLGDVSDPLYGLRVHILFHLDDFKWSRMYTDYNLHNMCANMFNNFFAAASGNHTEEIKESMISVMVNMIQASKTVASRQIQDSIVSHLLENVPEPARDMAREVLKRCMWKLMPIASFLIWVLKDWESKSHSVKRDYYVIIDEVNGHAGWIMVPVIPSLCKILKTFPSEAVAMARYLRDAFNLLADRNIVEFKQYLYEYIQSMFDVKHVQGIIKDSVMSMLSKGYGTSEILSIFLQKLDEPDKQVRSQALYSLCEATSVCKVPPLIMTKVLEHLDHSEPDVKGEASLMLWNSHKYPYRWMLNTHHTKRLLTRNDSQNATREIIQPPWAALAGEYISLALDMEEYTENEFEIVEAILYDIFRSCQNLFTQEICWRNEFYHKELFFPNIKLLMVVMFTVKWIQIGQIHTKFLEGVVLHLRLPLDQNILYMASKPETCCWFLSKLRSILPQEILSCGVDSCIQDAILHLQSNTVWLYTRGPRSKRRPRAKVYVEEYESEKSKLEDILPAWHTIQLQNTPPQNLRFYQRRQQKFKSMITLHVETEKTKASVRRSLRTTQNTQKEEIIYMEEEPIAKRKSKRRCAMY